MHKPVVLTAEIFPWSENFATGLPQVDEQHKRLVHLLNTLATHVGIQSDIETLMNVFDELIAYAGYHFQTEEQVWNRYFSGDEWETAHKITHIDFASEVTRLKQSLNGKSVDEVSQETLSFMTHWLAFHILESDKRMAMAALSMQSGSTLGEAKKYTGEVMSGSMKILIDTILSMYDHLSSRSLELIREIVARQKAEARLLLAATAFNNTLESICITDPDMNIVDANPAFYRNNRYPESETLGRSLKALKSGFEDESAFSSIQRMLYEQGYWRGEILNRATSGELEAEWVTISCVKEGERKSITHFVVIFSSITHLIRQRQDLERQAQHDALTGLPNRLLLSDRLNLAMAHAERKGLFLAVCYLDLDGFKPVNDRLGHSAGDRTLQEVALRLGKVLRAEDTIARLGGDEFVLLLGDLKQAGDCVVLLDRVLGEVARPIPIQHENVGISASIGVAFYPKDGDGPDALLRLADEAMYEAKRLGKSRYCFYANGH